MNISGIESLHHLHLWTIDEKESAFSVHIVIKEEVEKTKLIDIKDKIRKFLNKQLQINHFSVQFDYLDENCPQTRT